MAVRRVVSVVYRSLNPEFLDGDQCRSLLSWTKTIVWSVDAPCIEANMKACVWLVGLASCVTFIGNSFSCVLRHELKLQIVSAMQQTELTEVTVLTMNSEAMLSDNVTIIDKVVTMSNCFVVRVLATTVTLTAVMDISTP